MIVTTGRQTSDGVVRQQFFVSANGGASWQLAPVHAPGGGQPPLGYQATRLAGGPRGWVAIGTAGPQAIWTSKDGLSWTLAATHGITRNCPAIRSSCSPVQRKGSSRPARERRMAARRRR